MSVVGGCIIASTLQIKQSFKREPSLQDSQQLEKPHLLPWSGARATKEKEGKTEWKTVEGGEDGLEASSKTEAACVGVWGREAEEGNHRRITSEGLCASVKLFSVSETVI